MFKVTLVLLSLVLPLAPAMAEDACPTVELDEPGLPLAGIPVWKDDENPACFAYSSSAMAEVWIRENWTQANPNYSEFKINPDKEFAKMMKDSRKNEILDASRGRTCEAFNFIMQRQHQLIADPAQAAYPVAHCTQWGLKDDIESGQKVIEDPGVIEAHLHELLTVRARAMPYAIEFCSEVLNDFDKDFITNRAFPADLSYLNDESLVPFRKSKNRQNFDKKCGFHSSVVIGQKRINDVCYFKIRNSWGIHNRDHGMQDNGNYWVPATALSRNILRTIEMSP